MTRSYSYLNELIETMQEEGRVLMGFDVYSRAYRFRHRGSLSIREWEIIMSQAKYNKRVKIINVVDRNQRVRHEILLLEPESEDVVLVN